MGWRAKVGAAALSVTLAACVSVNESPGISAPDLGEHPLALYPAPEAGLDAALPARLDLRDGCLDLVDEDGASWLALWPWPDTLWGGTGVKVGDTNVALGETAVFVGGESMLSEQDIAAHEWVEPPDPDCLIQKVWWIQYVDGGT